MNGTGSTRGDLAGRYLDIAQVERIGLPDETSVVTLKVSLQPGRLEDEFPRYARFLRKVVRPVEMLLALDDASGAQWLRPRRGVGIDHLEVARLGGLDVPHVNIPS
ncbi:MAG: hypothetical protein V3U22_07170 [Vicinamibacteria bacterium]